MADITRVRRVQVSTHSRPKAAGITISFALNSISFQLTAARRRLGVVTQRPVDRVSFNSQPPEGGWFYAALVLMHLAMFQLTAARRRLVIPGWR